VSVNCHQYWDVLVGVSCTETYTDSEPVEEVVNKRHENFKISLCSFSFESINAVLIFLILFFVQLFLPLSRLYKQGGTLLQITPSLVRRECSNRLNIL
jgi:hypothetical protein